MALGIAGLINLAMVAVASSVFHPAHAEVAEIETAYRTLIPLLGGGAATVFLIALLASGLSSSVVGTMAGQGIMQDFLSFRVPLWVRRLVTMVPTFVVVAAGADPTWCLVVSQVVLSIALPVPMIALLRLVSDRAVMGEHRPERAMLLLAGVAAVAVLGLNGVLLVQVVTG